MDPNANPFLAMLGNEGFWELPMVSGIAFNPSPARPQYLDATSGPIRDGVFDLSCGEKICYRFYVPSDPAEVVVFFFHGNAEVCTNMDDAAAIFHRCGAALLSIDYRGYGWSTGQPSLLKLCADAEECFVASQPVLEAAGCGGAPRVAMGRSIGATCAVHLASHQAASIQGLIVDSGLMSIKGLPMVQMFATQLLGPQAAQVIQGVQEPFDTLGKMAAVGCPTLIMHGNRDEIVPVAQSHACHERCASNQKVLRNWELAGHNDVFITCGAEWTSSIEELLQQAKCFDNPFPAGSTVEAHSLSTTAFNGLRGKVMGPKGERFRVKFPAPNGEKALKPNNLRLLDPSELAEEPAVAEKTEEA